MAVSRIDELTGRTGESGSSVQDRIDELTGQSGASGSSVQDRIDELTGNSGKSNSQDRIAQLTGSSASMSESLPVLDPNGNPVTSHIWETAKGAGRGLIDFISRPNYAAAGAAEELLSPQGGGLSAVPGRVASEIFSGIGSIKGQKEGFGQVMEQAGVGEMGKLSDVLGFMYNDTGEGIALQRGGILDPTGRGAVGLAGDIFLDPTTYITGGGKTAARFLTNKGVRYLSKEGRAAKDLIVKDMELAYKLVEDSGDTTLRNTARRQLREELNKRVETLIEADPKRMLDSTGIRWFGQEVVSGPAIRALSDRAKEIALSLPGGAHAARAAEAVSRGIGRTFDAFADARDLPQGERDALKGLLRENRSVLAAHNTELKAQWSAIEDEYGAAAKTLGKGKDGRVALGKRFADWREQTAQVALTASEAELFPKIAKMYDDMEAVLVHNGIITPEQAAKFAGKYLHHEYGNLDALMEMAANAGKSTDKTLTTESFQRERQFATYAEAEAASKRLREKGLQARAVGAKRGVYGALEPEYDAMKNLASYIDQTTSGIWKKKTYDEARERFGLELDPFLDPTKLHVLDNVKVVPKADRLAIDAYLQDARNIKELEQSFEFDVKVARTPELRRAQTVLARVAEEPNRQLGRVQDAIQRGLGSTLREMSRGLTLVGDAAEFELGLARGAETAKTRLVGRAAERELRAAEKNVAAVWDSLPIKYYEKKTLKNIDEANYFKRRGWDVTGEQLQDGRTVYTAYTTKEVTPREYASFSSRLDSAKAQVQAIKDRAANEGIRNTRQSIDAAKRILGRSSGLESRQRERIARTIQRSEEALARAEARTVTDINRGMERAQSYVDAATIRAERDVRVNYDGWGRAVNEAKTLLPKLTPDGQRELARELVSRARSESQLLRVEDAVGSHLMPDLQVVKPGQVDPWYHRWGKDGGEYVKRKDGLWGDKEIHIPSAVAKMVENAPRDFIMDAANKQNLGLFVRAWDKYNNAFKRFTYPFYPSGAARDTYNNVMQAFLGIGVGAFARPLQAFRVLKGTEGDILRLGSRDFKASELKRMLMDLGVIDPSGAAYVQYTGEQGAKKASLMSKAVAKRGSVDNWTRTQLMLNNLADGMSPEDAARVVKEFLFDYGELSAFDRNVMRRAMPFYVFPRKAIESYGVAAVKTPGRVVNLAKPFRGREDENNKMTSWEGEGFKLRLDSDGKTLTMLNGVDLPVRTMDMLWAGSPTKTLNRWLSMASPAIKVPYEFLSGQDPFRGQPLGRQQSYFLGPILKEMPKVAQHFAGFHEDKDAAGRPKYTVRMDRVQVLAEAALISRILSMGERNVREQAKDPDVAARMLDFLTGLRLKDINFDEQQKLKIDAAIRTLTEEKVQQGELKKGSYIFKPKVPQ